jgi:beta-RFAP synthase
VDALREIHVRAPARLHFGLFSFGTRGRRYGGVGAMVAEPALHLTMRPAAQFHLSGSAATELVAATRRCCRAWGVPHPPPCQIEVVHAVPRHVGLGSGTQLASALAAGLNAWLGRPALSPRELAVVTGRGRRSAVGTYGFLAGGFVVEAGRGPRERLAPLERRIDIPADWRFVLVTSPARRGLSGSDEQRAFAHLPPVPETVRAQLVAEVREHMVPALLAADCRGFGESVYRYGRLAGSCFAAVQGGPYNGPHIEQLVELARSLGTAGVGQSSWGPTVYCLVASQPDAERLCQRLRAQAGSALDIRVTAADNRGGVVTRIE